MATAPDTTPAIAYLRTSSAANVGADKDSDKRQRSAIDAFAQRAGFAVRAEFYDAAVSGAEPLEARPGFAALLDRIEGDGIRVVLIEDASRFARDLVTQELGILSLIGRGVRVVTATGDDLTNTDDPFKVAMRQIAGAFAQLEKARLVAKLAHARDRIRRERGRCEGRKPFAATKPEVVAMAKSLRSADRCSLRRISANLAAVGHLNERGRPYSATSVQRMLEG